MKMAERVNLKKLTKIFVVLGAVLLYAAVMWKPVGAANPTTVSYGGYTYKSELHASQVSGDLFSVFYKKASGGSYREVSRTFGLYNLMFAYNNRIYYNYCYGYGDYHFGYLDIKNFNNHPVKDGVHAIAKRGYYVLLQEQSYQYRAPLRLYVLNLKTGSITLISSYTHEGCATITSDNKIYYGQVVCTNKTKSTIRMYRCNLGGGSKTCVSGNIYNVYGCSLIRNNYIKFTNGSSTSICHYSDTKYTQSISASNKDVTLGCSSFSLGAKRTVGNGKLTYSSSNKSVAMVSSSGIVTVKSAGKVTITIKAAETGTYKACTKKITLVVRPKTVSVKTMTSPSTGKLKVNWYSNSAISGYQLRLATNSSFTDAKVYTINSRSTTSKTFSGLNTSKRYYVRMRTFKTFSNGTKIYSKWGSCKSLQLTSPAKISLSKGSTGGSSITLYASTSGGTVTWKSSNTSVATVSGGKVTAKGAGTAVITATVTKNGTSASATYTIKVGKNTSYGSWSSWTLSPVSSSSTRQVRTKTFYRYYCFLCPVCGGREPFQGTSDCHQYTLSMSNAVTKWFSTPYSQCSSSTYSYSTAKRYTYSLGDGLRWNFSSGNLYDTAVGTKDTDSAAIVIKTGYSYRSISYSYYIQSAY